MSRVAAPETNSKHRAKASRADRHASTQATALDIVSLQPPTKRRRSWIVGGVLMIAVAGLLGAWLFSVSTDTIRIVTAAHDLQSGEVLGPDDVRVIEIGRTAELRAVTADQQDLVVGLAARSAIPAGTVLNTGLFADRSAVVPDGHVVVGVMLKPGAVPASTIGPGDEVAVYTVVSDPGGQATSTRVADAAVWSISPVEGQAGAILVSLLVADALVEPVAAAAGTDSVRLGLLP